mmetsp:Transcript_780/g.1640  ORF Transcript_780/g.1640 Transcript_780/m.1640 type:complete len:155 (+) Transcript_780:23-487(+)
MWNHWIETLGKTPHRALYRAGKLASTSWTSRDYMLKDAPLTAEGLDQAKEQHGRLFPADDGTSPIAFPDEGIMKQFREDAANSDTVYVVSPLRRAISTMFGIFQENLFQRTRTGGGKQAKVKVWPDLQEIGNAPDNGRCRRTTSSRSPLEMRRR